MKTMVRCLRLGLVTALLGLIGEARAAAPAAASPPTPVRWTLAVIGDQQFAVTRERGFDHLDRFSSQSDWLGANAASLNLRMVMQVGDIVEKAVNEDEWERASAVMAKLDAATHPDGRTGIPWSVAYGNHEILGVVLRPTFDPAGPGPSARYRHYFGSATGPHRYAGQKEFGGVSRNDLNTWHVIRSGGDPRARSWLMLSLEVDVPGGGNPDTGFDAVRWAQGIIDAHPGLPTVIATHVFEGTRHGPPHRAYLEGFGHNSQREIFDKLVRDNPQVFMVLSGHTSEETHQFRPNAAGHPVLQMVTDYNKWLGTAGDGFFRLLEIDEPAGVVRVKTYSALLGRHRTDPNSAFEFAVDFPNRFPAGGKTPAR